ncbi:hypothetical protein R70199_07616 [Paraburkholderia domus]|nr:hypothetical protein R70199_07616 [Paraburkholderia domus]
MPVVCPKIADGQAAARQPISVQPAAGSRIPITTVPRQSVYASSHETLGHEPPFACRWERTFERLLLRPIAATNTVLPPLQLTEISGREGCPE